MPSRIARLYADNYRSFVNFELKPGRRSLLLGYNGSGKSSVFDVLYAIRLLVVSNEDAKVAFPTDTVTKFGGSTEQRFELDVEIGRGTLRYTLLLAHDLEADSVAIVLEELALDGKPAYGFKNGEVQLHGEDGGPTREPFPFSAQRSFLASLDPKAPLSPIASFKELLSRCWILRLDPPRIGAAAPSEEDSLARGASNFASYCRFLLLEDPDRMQRAHEVLREIIPGFQHLRLQSAGRAKVLVATFRYPSGSSYDLDFDALSDGQKALIVHYTVLHGPASRIPVLCLDEPDNFVSIREIQPFLTELSDLSDETGLQVLLISHSPEVIDYIGASGAILLERPDGGHTRVRSIEAPGPLRLSELMARGWLPGGSDGAS
jgi:energy-coupling factor transporter ATP-binding protein EcfA2